MKIFIKYILITLLLVSCNKDDQPKNPIDALPPITTTGENTIGCLVNGKPFTDKGLMNNFYQFVDGEYFLGINMSYDQGLSTKNLRIQLRKVVVEENVTYLLNKNDIDNGDFIGGKGQYTFSENYLLGGFQYDTNINFYGEITFIQFDTGNQIISGIFEFQAKEITTGEIINITDGRFDLTFTN